MKGATSAKLVERMLDPAVHGKYLVNLCYSMVIRSQHRVILDHHFLQTILLTHKIFMSSKELLALIVGKYAESTAGLSEEAIAQSPILLRYAHFYDFFKDATARNLTHFPKQDP